MYPNLLIVSFFCLLHVLSYLVNEIHLKYEWRVMEGECVTITAPKRIKIITAAEYFSFILGGNQHERRNFFFLHVKPYNKDIYDHIQCSTALLRRTVQSWELELIADIAAGWKQQRSMCTEPSKNTINTCFKWRGIQQLFSGVLWSTNTKTQS